MIIIYHSHYRNSFDSSTHLAPQDVAIDRHDHPTTLQVCIKASKMDQYRHGTLIYLTTTGNDLFPVAVVAAYLARRPPVGDPLFLLASGELLSQYWHITVLL